MGWSEVGDSSLFLLDYVLISFVRSEVKKQTLTTYYSFLALRNLLAKLGETDMYKYKKIDN